MERKRDPRYRGLIALSVVALMIVAAPALGARGGGGSGSGGGGKGKGGNSTGDGSSYLVLKVLTGSDTSANWGEDITFEPHTSATTEPHVNVKCTQGGTVVYGASTGYYDSYPWPWTQVMTLRSQSWTGGAADCTATLSAYSGAKITVLATLPFAAGA